MSLSDDWFEESVEHAESCTDEKCHLRKLWREFHRNWNKSEDMVRS